MRLQDEAIHILNEAYNRALQNPVVECKYKEFIDYVLNNTHLTYKYILFTALLAKSADENINPLCLQKHSRLSGAYDARSLCHKVIVPFETTVLKKVLGGSNEPFLNKPARFPELSKSNAVRRGNDQEILNTMCDTLPLIVSSSDAYDCLVYLLHRLIELRDNLQESSNFATEASANIASCLLAYVMKALEISYEGEVLVLMTAGVYHLLYSSNPEIIVEVHPVNQSGKSSREISDLDIYMNGSLFASNELKDKSYAANDVRHAADKVLKAGGSSLLFIEGPRCTGDTSFVNEIERDYISNDFWLKVISYKDFFPLVISLIPDVDCKEFMSFVLSEAHEKKFKAKTISYLYELAQEMLGLE